MLKFTKKMIITGKEVRTKADKTTYVLLHILGENGQTISCVYRGVKDLNIDSLQMYEITFEVKLGKYTSLSVVDVVKA